MLEESQRPVLAHEGAAHEAVRSALAGLRGGRHEPLVLRADPFSAAAGRRRAPAERDDAALALAHVRPSAASASMFARITSNEYAATHGFASHEPAPLM